MHPCTSVGSLCCNARLSVVGLRYTSDLWDQAATVRLTFEIWPSCGDGLTLTWVLTHNQNQESLFKKTFLQSAQPPHRETVEKRVSLLPGDTLLLSVHPGLNHDCDGVYIHDMQVWQSMPVNV